MPTMHNPPQTGPHPDPGRSVRHRRFLPPMPKTCRAQRSNTRPPHSSSGRREQRTKQPPAGAQTLQRPPWNETSRQRTTEIRLNASKPMKDDERCRKVVKSGEKRPNRTRTATKNDEKSAKMSNKAKTYPNGRSFSRKSGRIRTKPNKKTTPTERHTSKHE